MKCLEYPFDSDYILQKKRALKREMSSSDAAFIEKRIAILSGVTVGDISNVLELFLLNYGIKPTFHIGQYNRFYEDVIFENQELKNFSPDIIVIHTTARNLSDGAVPDKLQSVWSKIRDGFFCPIIQNNFEFPAYGMEADIDSINKLNGQISDYAGSHNNFYINDIQYLSSYYGLEKWHSDRDYYSYKYGFSIGAIPLFCHNLAKIIRSLYGKSQKCLVLDLDDTLWGGIVGEAGATGIELGPDTALGEAYAAFQKYVKALRDRGIILAVCSKNDEGIARDAFSNPNMVLSLDDFAVFRANWCSKAENISAIADTLNILPESIVFIDDNPAERELVRQALPDVKVPEVAGVTDFIRQIEGAGYFYFTNITEDDKNRGEYYAADAKRSEAMAAFHDYGEYLESLKMSSEIRPFAQEHLERITQLVNKTNQFNLTTKRYTHSEIEQIAQDDGYITLYATLNDKFGSNGIVSALIGEIENEMLHIRLWVMSCRVFKRDLELAVFDSLVERCRSISISKLRGYYYPTEKNIFVSELYSELGFVCISDAEWEISISDKYEHKNKHIKIT